MFCDTLAGLGERLEKVAPTGSIIVLAGEFNLEQPDAALDVASFPRTWSVEAGERNEAAWQFLQARGPAPAVYDMEDLDKGSASYLPTGGGRQKRYDWICAMERCRTWASQGLHGTETTTGRSSLPSP